jgi:hypothetical protein
MGPAGSPPELPAAALSFALARAAFRLVDPRDFYSPLVHKHFAT